MRDFLNDDLVYAARSIRRHPGFAALIVFLLALPIGANAAMFSLIDSLLLRAPHGIGEPDQLRRLYVQERRRTGPVIRDRFVYLEFRQLDTALVARARLAAYTPPDSFRITGETPRYVPGGYASSEFFGLLGVRPALGRFYTEEEDRMGAGANVAVISHAFWRRWFGAQRSALGQTIRIDDEPFTVIGVAPEGFAGPDLGASDMWLPLATLRQQRIGDRAWYEEWRSDRLVRILARLRPATADAWLETRASAARRRGGAGEAEIDTTAVVVAGPLLEPLAPSVEPRQDVAIATRLTAVTLIVLLVACANVANLLLGRAIERRRETAVCLALGVSRGHLVMQLFLEGLLLAGAGGLAGVAIAVAGGTALRAALLPNTNWAGGVFDGRVALFTAAATILTALLGSLAPAVQASRAAPIRSLRVSASDGSAPRSRLRAGLLVAQAALAFALLAGAGLFVRSLGRVRAIDLGYDVERIVSGTIAFKDSACNCRSPFPGGYETELAEGLASVASRVARLPDVEGVALADASPMQGYSMARAYPLGRDSMPRLNGQGPALTAVSPTYFAVTGQRILRGRAFTEADGLGAPLVLVVNETMARVVWPGDNPLGKCVRFHTPSNPCHTVIGVVATGHVRRVIEPPAMQFYVPLEQGTGTQRSTPPERLIARATPERAESVAARIRAELLVIAGTAGEPRVSTMTAVLGRQWRPWQLGAALFSAFGLFALLIASLGVYSSVAFTVRQRRHELGVRAALGARPSDIVRLVVGDGVRTVGIGILLGTAFTLSTGHAVASLLYETSPTDARVLVGVTAALLLAAGLASLFPARWAARADPASVLRLE